MAKSKKNTAMQPKKQASSRAAHLAPYQFKPGQSGNPKGKKPGKSLKEWVREKLLTMNEEERIVFLRGVPRDIVWRMAEGNPHQTEEHSGGIKITGVSIKVRK